MKLSPKAHEVFPMSDKTAFHSILVPVDGSTLAEAAIPYALTLAERARSKVQFVFVYQDRLPLEPAELAWQYLLQLTDRARERLGDSVSSALLHGPVAANLVKQARKIGADLVIMTTHGRGGLERAWLGSVTDQLIRRIGIPVLVIRPADGVAVPEAQPSEILVPLDGSTLAETALQPAAALAKLWDAELTAVQIVYPIPILAEPDRAVPEMSLQELTAIARASAEEYVRLTAESLRGRGVKASGMALIGTDGPAQQLRELARPGQVSLIAIATHGRGGIRRFILGSVADKLVRTAEVPVLVVPPMPRTRPARQPNSERVRALDIAEAFAF
jgi:nucleotide-binding universal stress UspA family protein